MITTKLQLKDKLPLTCSRKGTCCHGNQVLLNPWELNRLAFEKQISVKEFRDLYCDWGGVRLKFDGEKDHRGKNSCSQYIPNFGCSLHEGRPLACRLFPIGRQIQNDEVQYIFQGKTFPCLDGCPEVNELPKMTVEDYLKDQQTSLFEQAQDAYLEVMQNMADIAFMLLLDSGLAASGDTKTLRAWQRLASVPAESLIESIGREWIDLLTIPNINFSKEKPVEFAQAHEVLLQEQAQIRIDSSKTLGEMSETSILMISIAYFLAKALGAEPKELSELWVRIALENGAKI
ncbi:MAG: YkgJ family cysteine cluster protein [Flavobacteriia bacterium]|jgi:Fe-S-cluster containining protein